MPAARLALIALFAVAAPAAAQTADNVLVVINENSPASVAVGGHYAKARGIGREQIVLLETSTEESVNYAEFTRTIETPLADWLSRRSLQDRILYIVLTKGVPIRIVGTGGLNGTVASVDSELTLLYRKMLGKPTAMPGREANPLFLDEKPIAEAKRFTRFASDIYLVTRLDGFTVDDVLQLIDRGLAPSQQGRVVLDQRRQLLDRGGGDRWLGEAAARVNQAFPGRALLENTRELADTEEPVLGYYSWGSNDDANRRRGAGLKFAPGALAGMFVSTDGRTFQEPPADWLPGISNRPPSLFGSGSQSLAGDLVREGATGVSAHVDEPYLDATVRPHVLFPAYLAGFNLAEAFYLAMPFLSWQTIVIGDPLCAPFREMALTAAEIAKDIDPATELPALFAERRLAALEAGGLNREGLQVYLRAAVMFSRDDKATAERLLREAREKEPKLVAASLQLATIHEERKEYDQAIAEYRLVIAANDRNAVALNNLAYVLAVHKKQPAEALPYADQAFAIARQPTVADTLGWIHYLLGNHRAAAPLLELAATAMPDHADVQLHAAFVRAANGEMARAHEALQAALKIDEKLGSRDDVKELRRKIDGGGR